MNALSGELPDVVGRIKEAVRKEIRVSHPTSNYASKLGSPCTRQLTYFRTEWKSVAPITPEKKMMFDLGNVYEKHVAKGYLEKAGFEIVEHDRPIQAEASGLLERVKIHGRIDFIVRDTATKMEFPVEVKSVKDYAWEKLDTIEDMMASKQYWVRAYPGQLMMYLLAKEYPIGLFLLINKTTGHPKAIWVHQDYTYAEELIKKAEMINAHIDAGTLPERIKYEESICGKCDFKPICLPDVERTEASILTDAELEEDLEERERLKPLAKAYDDIDESVKARLKEIPKAFCGRFEITGRVQSRVRMIADPTLPKTESWVTTIKPTGGKKS